MTSLMFSYCRPGVSHIHGVGMIAVRKIPKGTILMPSQGVSGTWKTLEWAHERNIEPGVVKMMQDYVCGSAFDSNDNLFVPSTPMTSFQTQMLINHSSNPNTEMNHLNQLFATKDIQYDEELTQDYLLTCGECYMSSMNINTV